MLTEPPLDWRSQPVRVGDVQVPGRARAGVEVLVGAPDGVADPERVEVDRHRTGGVAQIPDHGRERVDGCHVGERPRAVSDVRQDDECAARDVVGLRPEHRVGWIEEDQLQPARTSDPLQHVAVGREVLPVRREDPQRRVRIKQRVDELKRFTVAESVTSTWPGRAPSTSASTSPVRVGASIQSGQPLTIRSPHSSIC